GPTPYHGSAGDFHLRVAPMRDLLAALGRAFDSGRECVLCAVVETRGSTPQKAGAAMLVYPDGSQTGTLGGGCVEAEVKRQALRCTEAIVIAEEAGGPPVGSRYLFDIHGQLAIALAASPAPAAVQANLVPLSKRPKASLKQGVCYLPVLPRITILIVGGGHV